MSMTDRTQRAATVVDRRAAFEALADAELDGAYRLAGVILGDTWQAQDATHDAVVQAWMRYGSLRDPDRFGAWFQRILVNVCRDRLRQRQRRPTAALGVARASGGVDATAIDDRLVLDDAFERLTPDHQVALALRFYEDLTVDQIAQRVGVPKGTVKSRIHFAIERMRTALGGEGRPR
jgi:RNA polymerase sigma-70 factor (ECF subfamily)